MKWSHLPEPGGIYAQHPVLMERFYYILAERGAYEAQESAKRSRPTGKPKARGM